MTPKRKSKKVQNIKHRKETFKKLSKKPNASPTDQTITTETSKITQNSIEGSFIISDCNFSLFYFCIKYSLLLLLISPFLTI